MTKMCLHIFGHFRSIEVTYGLEDPYVTCLASESSSFIRSKVSICGPTKPLTPVDCNKKSPLLLGLINIIKFYFLRGVSLRDTPRSVADRAFWAGDLATRKRRYPNCRRINANFFVTPEFLCRKCHFTT